MKTIGSTKQNLKNGIKKLKPKREKRTSVRAFQSPRLSVVVVPAVVMMSATEASISASVVTLVRKWIAVILLVSLIPHRPPVPIPALVLYGAAITPLRDTIIATASIVSAAESDIDSTASPSNGEASELRLGNIIAKAQK